MKSVDRAKSMQVVATVKLQEGPVLMRLGQRARGNVIPFLTQCLDYQ